ncbi:MAG: hypothetical protein AB1649_21200 [Chloroflexota bacterium]
MPTYQTAQVRIQNGTTRPLRGASVVHKYSDNYKNMKQWDNPIPPGAYTPADFRVEYHTGFLTTGRDWWLIAWEYKADDKVYYTDPDNLRSFIDGLEVAGQIIIPAALAAAGALVTAGTGAAVAVAVGAAAGNRLATKLLNDESTGGFKQHILRDEDAGQTVIIVIRDDNTVAIQSPSGVSETVSSVRQLPYIQEAAFPPVLDPQYYIDLHLDLGHPPLSAAVDHWLQPGTREGRRSSPAFDVKFYLEHHPDLVAAFGQGNYAAAVQHWIQYGIQEGRQSAPNFDVKFYLNHFADLKKAFGDNYEAAINHWLQYGVREGRQGIAG